MLTVNTYAKVWKVKEVEGKNYYSAQISTSKKLENGNYETDFSNYVTICGNAANTKLEEGDTFQVKKFSVSNSYDKEKGVTYYNFFINEIDDVKHHTAAKEDFAPAEDEDLPFK